MKLVSLKKLGSIVVVLGMHRSGTSAVAELIASCGYSVPGTPLAAIKDVNERGFWESQEIVDFNENLLSILDTTWYALSPINLGDSDTEEIEQWLADQLDIHGSLVIKDPRINLLLPTWLKILDSLHADVKFINVNRHPDYVARSIMRRDGLSEATCFGLWLKYNMSMLTEMADRDCYFINYEELLGDDKDLAFLHYLGVSEDECTISVVESRLARNKDFLTFDQDVAQSARCLYEIIKSNRGLQHGMPSGVDFVKNLIGKDFLNPFYLKSVDDINFRLVASSRLVHENGMRYKEALDVIKEKELGLEENKKYIDSCHERIRFLEDRIFVSNSSLDEILGCGFFKSPGENISADFFDKLDFFLNQLHLSVVEVSADGESLVDLNKLLELYRSKISELDELIACKDAGLQENIVYIDGCHKRINDLEGVIKYLELGIAENDRYINDCHNRIATLDELLAKVSESRAALELSHQLVCAERDQVRLSLNSVSGELDVTKAEVAWLQDKASVMESSFAKLLSQIESLATLITESVGPIRNYEVLDGVDKLSQLVNVVIQDNEYLLENLNKSLNNYSLLSSVCQELQERIAVLTSHPLLGIINKKIIYG